MGEREGAPVEEAMKPHVTSETPLTVRNPPKGLSVAFDDSATFSQALKRASQDANFGSMSKDSRIGRL